jgi:hypothetical protein
MTQGTSSQQTVKLELRAFHELDELASFAQANRHRTRRLLEAHGVQASRSHRRGRDLAAISCALDGNACGVEALPFTAAREGIAATAIEVQAAARTFAFDRVDMHPAVKEIAATAQGEPANLLRSAAKAKGDGVEAIVICAAVQDVEATARVLRDEAKEIASKALDVQAAAVEIGFNLQACRGKGSSSAFDRGASEAEALAFTANPLAS